MGRLYHSAGPDGCAHGSRAYLSWAATRSVGSNGRPTVVDDLRREPVLPSSFEPLGFGGIGTQIPNHLLPHLHSFDKTESLSSQTLASRARAACRRRRIPVTIPTGQAHRPPVRFLAS
ncbi:hypothetical protein V6N13_042733 [Hibiscus sabdariffa]|uniref:Uncharacterized protein n=1 Tax=Hibiscus sabdariffa TaxID=183260 RepID=A0ABR2G3X6_9ROSI